MYQAGKSLMLRLLRVPPEPHPPEGSAGSLRTFRASPSYYRYRMLGWTIGNGWLVIVALVVLTGVSAGLARAEAPRAVRLGLTVLESFGLIGLVSGIILSYVTMRLDYEMRWYMVTDKSLRIREGVWHVHEMTMTFANIQNLSISQGPIQRLFGIADLRVQSAGGGGAQAVQGKEHQGAPRDLHVGYFKGVDNAQAIRDLVLQRLKLLRDAGLGDHDDAHASGAPHAPVAAPAEMLAALRELRGETAMLRAAVDDIIR